VPDQFGLSIRADLAITRKRRRNLLVSQIAQLDIGDGRHALQQLPDLVEWSHGPLGDGLAILASLSDSPKNSASAEVRCDR